MLAKCFQITRPYQLKGNGIVVTCNRHVDAFDPQLHLNHIWFCHIATSLIVAKRKR